MDLRGQVRQGQPPMGWPAHAEPAWSLVRRWPGIRGEDKLAWAYLWARSRGGSELVSTTPADVAADQGTTADAGRARLKNLAAAGLIVARSRERSTGVWLLEVPDPAELEIGRVLKSDGQRTLFEKDDRGDLDGETLSEAGVDLPAGVLRLPSQVGFAMDCPEVPRDRNEEPPELPRCRNEEPPEEPPEVPRFADLRTPSIARARSGLSTFEDLRSSEEGFYSEEGASHRGSSGGSSAGYRGSSVDRAADPDAAEVAALATLIDRRRTELGADLGRRPAAEPRRVTGGLRDVLSRLDSAPADFDVQQSMRVDTLTREILRRVADPALRDSPARKLAAAVVAGQIPDAQLWQLLANVDKNRAGEGSTRTARGVPCSAYFVTGAQTLCARCGVTWSNGSKPR